MEILETRFAEAWGRKAYALRVEVFVQEQGVPAEIEADEYDAEAVHLVAVEADGTVVGTLRIVDKGEAAKIGRVAVKKTRRGTGVGRAIMEEAMRRCAAAGYRQMVLGAQVTVIPFYERLGFVAEGPVFDDAGIPHRTMRRATDSATKPRRHEDAKRHEAL